MQTSEGARKAYETRLKRYGIEGFQAMSRKGGQMTTPGGFGTNRVGEDGLTGRERARMASQKAHYLRKHKHDTNSEDDNGTDEQDLQDL